ncbi:hypothetical protein D3C71_2016920 [compost metagenome]
MLLRKPPVNPGICSALRLSWSLLNEMATDWSATPSSAISFLSWAMMRGLALLSSITWVMGLSLKAWKYSRMVGTW